MNITKAVCLLLCFVLISSLAACNPNPEEIGGVPVTPEMLESVSRSLAEKNETEPQTDITTIMAKGPVGASAETATDIPDVVYWTESGTVYHLTDTCATLRNSTDILHGSVEEALSAKKERVCKSCS